MKSPFQLAFSPFSTSRRGILFPCSVWVNKKDVSCLLPFFGKVNGGKTSKASENTQHLRLELQCGNFLSGKILFEFSECTYESYYKKWGGGEVMRKQQRQTDLKVFLRHSFPVKFPRLSFPIGNVLVVSMERVVFEVKLFYYIKNTTTSKQHRGQCRIVSGAKKGSKNAGALTSTELVGSLRSFWCQLVNGMLFYAKTHNIMC